MPTRIFTIGHSDRSWPDFLALLTEHSIELLVDVRSYPGSRHAPQFNAEVLPEELAQAGIGYLHMRNLGGRRRTHKDSDNTVWRNASFRGYADYMETPEFAAALEELIDLAEQQVVAIMCAEAVWWRCHRSMVADALKARGFDVEHIMDGGELKPHPYTAPARIVDGELTYHEAQSDP